MVERRRKEGGNEGIRKRFDEGNEGITEGEKYIITRHEESEGKEKEGR